MKRTLIEKVILKYKNRHDRKLNSKEIILSCTFNYSGKLS